MLISFLINKSHAQVFPRENLISQQKVIFIVHDPDDRAFKFHNSLSVSNVSFRLTPFLRAVGTRIFSRLIF